MELQDNSYDCDPSVCLMADALVSGVPLSVITCAAVANSRLYIAMCLRTGVSDDLARLVTAEIRPGRGRLVTVRDSPTGDADPDNSGQESPYAKPRSNPPAFVYYTHRRGRGSWYTITSTNDSDANT